MAPSRPLPERVNPLLLPPDMPPYETLVNRRRLGQTDLAGKAGQVGTTNSTKQKNMGTFDYAHLRAPLPKNVISGIFKPAPPSYFLMRRSNDGYISATGMFKATFPWAEAVEEEAERKYIKSLPTTSTDETAGNVWIPPVHALQLAEEYQITTWIKALLDNRPIDVNPAKDTDSTPKAISPPPKFFMADATPEAPKLLPPKFATPQETLAAPTQARGRPRRSASPSKIASPKKTLATLRKPKTAKTSLNESVSSASQKDLQWIHVTGPITANSEKLASSSAPTLVPTPAEEPRVRVNVDEEVTVNGNVETTHTHVKVEMPAGSPELQLPEDAESMIAKAKEMVGAAVKFENEAGPSNPKKPKRKAEAIEPEAEVEVDEEVPTEAGPAVKKVKVESELRKERVKTRALIGISATLAIGALIPYFFNAF